MKRRGHGAARPRLSVSSDAACKLRLGFCGATPDSGKPCNGGGGACQSPVCFADEAGGGGGEWAAVFRFQDSLQMSQSPPPLKPTVTLGTHTWASLNSTKVQTHQHPCSLTHTHTHKLERALKQHPGWTKIILLKRSACGLYSAPLGPICSTGMRWPTRHGHFVEADL